MNSEDVSGKSIQAEGAVSARAPDLYLNSGKGVENSNPIG